MTLVVPNSGEVILLDAAIGKIPATVWTLRLYTVIEFALSSGTIVSYLTEASGGGYAAIPLTAANWTTLPGSPTSTSYPKQTFTFTGPLTTNQNVLGYYITQADGSLIYVEPLAATFTPATSGDTLDITPILTLGSIASD
jgi:hypothetical protein